MSEVTKYVAGAMFDFSLTKLALIRKNRPEWQAGHLNMIGGHVEPNELFISTMTREFWEETGVKTRKAQWRRFETLTGPTSYVACYCTIGDVTKLQTTTDEEVLVVSPDGFGGNSVIPNLLWLIPKAIDNLRNR